MTWYYEATKALANGVQYHKLEEIGRDELARLKMVPEDRSSIARPS